METQEISESVFHYYLKKNSEPKIIFKPGEQITIIVHTEQSGSVDILEFEDALFYSGSAVLHAEGVMTDADGEQKVLNGIAMLAKVITYAAESAEKNTPKKIILAGHTDSTADTIYNLSLSQARSRSVYYLLTGDRDNWVKTVEERCNPEKGPLQQLNYRNYDLRQVLMWVATSPDVAQYCKDAGSSESTDWSQAHPGKIDDSPVNDDVMFRNAVKGFRNAYQTAFLNGGTKYKNASQGADHWGWAFDNDAPGWGAVFDIYQKVLAGKLSPESADAAAYLQKQREITLKTVLQNDKHDKNDNPWCTIGCSEHRPRPDDYTSDFEYTYEDNHKAQKDRRVEILFFDSDEFPDLPCHDSGCVESYCKFSESKDSCPVYGKVDGKRKFIPQYLWVDSSDKKQPDPETKIPCEFKILQNLKPVQNATCSIRVDNNADTKQALTDSQGILTTVLPIAAKSVEITFENIVGQFLICIKNCEIEDLYFDQEWKGMKQRLSALGYLYYVGETPLTNDFDELKNDILALKRFQEDQGLPVDGALTENTKNVLKKLYGL